MVMRLLVTGGLGFIGARFVLAAISSGRYSNVSILDAETYAADKKRLGAALGDIEVISASIRDEAALKRLDGRFDVVANFAAESHNDNSLLSPSIFFDTNVCGLVTLADYCVRNDALLHHVSTDEVFGDLPFDSAAKFGPGSSLRPSSPYSASKAAGDLLLAAWRRSFSLRFTLSNCSNNFGPGQHQEKLIPTLFRNMAAGKPAPIYGSGRNVRDWIHVDDHVRGILQILQSPIEGQTYFFGASDEVSNLDLALAIGSFLGLHHSQAVEFVRDRPGHDRRYAIDWSQTPQLIDWHPWHAKVLDSIPELYEHYSATDEIGRHLR